MTDADGHFLFEERPVEETPFGSVLIAIHSQHFAGGLDLGEDSVERPEEPIIYLEPSLPIKVSVVDVASRARPGAVVHHVVQSSRSQLPGGADLYERFLSQSAVADAAGIVELAPFRGDQALWAQAGDLLSSTWQGPRPSEVELILGESFTIGGSVVFPEREQWVPEYEGERRILVSGLTGNLWRPLARLRDVQEGEWGPVRVPRDGCTAYRVRLEGAPIMPQEERFERPPASSHRRIDFVGEKEAEVYLFVEDERQEPITNARAVVWWGNTIGPTDGAYAFGASRPDGYLYVGTFPPGRIKFRVTAPGYAAYENEVEVPSPEAFLISLERGGRIAGRCLHAGEPVRDFEVIYWNEGLARKHLHESFFERDDGSFVIDHVHAGDWSIHAATAKHPGGEPEVVRVEAERDAEVEIEIPTAIRGGGRVLSADSGEPLVHARVQPYSSGGIELSIPWGPQVAVAADGSFEVDAFVLGKNYVRVEADGYASSLVTATATSPDFVDLGDIRLFKPQELRVSLLGFEQLEQCGPSDVRAFTVEGHILAEKRFSEQGTLSFDGVPPGDHRLMISYPDGSWARLQLRLEPGKQWAFDHKVAGDRRLDVRVVDDGGDPLKPVPILIVATQEDTGVLVLRSKTAGEDGLAFFEGIRAIRAHVMVAAPEGTTLATKDIDFGSSTSLHTVIKIGEEPWRVLVVDKERGALAGAWVTVRSRNGHEIHGADDTDSDGWAYLFGLPDGDQVIDVQHGIAGRRFGVPFDLASKTQELVLEAEGELELEVRDGDLPLSGVVTRIETTGGVTLGEALQTDGQGVVRFGPLGEGAYHLAFRRADCWTAFVDRSLSAGEHARHELQMRRLGDLEITVLDLGRPVIGVTPVLRSVEFDVAIEEWVEGGQVRATGTLATDLQGKLRLEGLPRGRYSWSVSLEDAPLNGLFELSPGKVNEVVIHLPR